LRNLLGGYEGSWHKANWVYIISRPFSVRVIDVFYEKKHRVMGSKCLQPSWDHKHLRAPLLFPLLAESAAEEWKELFQVGSNVGNSI
jgi:hypothetical protein